MIDPVWAAFLPHNLPQTQGLYCFWRHKTPLYIGTASRIKTRLRGHNKQRALLQNRVTHVTWMELPSEVSRLERYRIERWLIDIHRPILNEAQGRPAKPSDTVREFLRASSAKAAKARREKIPPARRSEIAAKAAAARWNSPTTPREAV